MRLSRLHLASTLGLASLVAACGDDGGAADTGSGAGGAATIASSSTAGTGGAGPGAGGTSGAGGAGGSTTETACYQAEGPGAGPSNVWVDGAHTTTVTITQLSDCERSYTLTTTAPLRDGVPSNPRVVDEAAIGPVLRTGHELFDALYALALDEVREASVDSISNFAFNGGNPIPCPAGGCFETGRLWTYVWTRDTAYAVALGLGLLDPTRAKNSLALKTSARRDGTRPEIVQDTGTGGSYPISSDRAVWALGARALLRVLEGSERTEFAAVAREAAKNTVLRDREVVFDARDGLYRGEQSFLDWREQTYPAYVATDTAQIGMSKALSTNVAHLVLLELAGQLAEESGDSAFASQAADWATALRTAIRARFWVDELGGFSSFIPGPLDPAPTRRLDWLGASLAVLEGVGTPAEAQQVVANYPHLAAGAPVIWPQQQDVRIYHNRAIWPFVTAFGAKAAAKVGNASVVDHAVRSLVRGAAMNLSNMENFEVATGANWVEEGPTSGPVVNSQRQLWSVAGYVSMVHEVLFGLEPVEGGLRVAPRLPGSLRDSLFAGRDVVALSRVPYRGQSLSVRMHLPPMGAGDGLLTVTSLELDGVPVTGDVLDASALGASSTIDVWLGPPSQSAGAMTELSASDVGEYRRVFAPRTPEVGALSIVGDRIRVPLTVSEQASDIELRVYRDGEIVADALPGSTTSFTDTGSGDHATRTHCYAVEARFLTGGNASQRSKAACYWGPSSGRIATFGAQGFGASGGQLVFDHGRWHHENWGDPGDTLSVANVVATQSGRHLIQALAGNGAGGFDTGITCGVKRVDVLEGSNVIGGGQIAMPHLATWSDWRGSTFVEVELEAGKTYTVVLREDASSGNMSDYDHFALYNGTGGIGGRFNFVNVAELKVLALGDP
jgi:hypothetical protein